MDKIENNKKRHLKELRGFDNSQNLSGKALTDSEVYKEWKKSVTAEYNDQIEALKEALSDQYSEAKQKVIQDYPIFMAIAEDIGYDATGKLTNNNELEFIGEELARFITTIESEKDSFFLSLDVDKNKIFLIQCNALDERLDCEYYQPIHYQDLAKLQKSPYKNEILNRVCNRIVDGPFGSAIKAQDYVELGIPFIRVADVTRGEGSIKTDDLIYITEEAHKGIIRSKIVPNDVVIAKTGATMGAASLIPPSMPEANIRGDLAAITPNQNICSPQYLVTYINTSIGQRLFWRLDSGGTRGRVVIGNLKRYPIIIPSKEIQENIVAKMDDAYAAKKQKELEAQQLLESIDDYLLGELGIELPEPEENTIQSRIFVRNLSEVSGDRLDCNYNNKIGFILSQTGKHEIVYLKNLLIKSPQYGANEIAIDKTNIEEITYIRITDIDDWGYLKKNDLKTASNIEDKYVLNKDDLLFARSGSVGRCYLHTNDSHKSIFAGYLRLSVPCGDNFY